MYDAKDYYYDDEHSKTTTPNTVKNNQAVNFTFYFYYKYNLPLTTSTNIKDLNEVFFLDGSVSWPGGALTKLCRILEENNITYKEFDNNVIYEFIINDDNYPEEIDGLILKKEIKQLL